MAAPFRCDFCGSETPYVVGGENARICPACVKAALSVKDRVKEGGYEEERGFRILSDKEAETVQCALCRQVLDCSLRTPVRFLKANHLVLCSRCVDNCMEIIQKERPAMGNES